MRDAPAPAAMLNKVPEVTLYFWIIKVLCTTVGETAADYLNGALKLGLVGTSWAVGALLVAVLAVQFALRQYLPAIYWLAVVLLSVAGTLITDNLTDNLGISLVTTTLVFSVAIAAVFALWWASEHTLSVRSIVTRRREAYYWLAILFTFALGTAAGDLAAERFALGYLPAALLFGTAIAAIAFVHFRFGLNAILSFWTAYILTRPLGASLGDFLSQLPAVGGLGLGPMATSGLFLGTIVGLVVHLTMTREDEIPAVPRSTPPAFRE